MNRHCSCNSPYQPTANLVYLDYLHLTKQDDDANERSKAQELSLRPLSTSELEEHHRRRACLLEAAKDRLAKFEPVTAVERRALTAFHHCDFTNPAMWLNRSDDAHRQSLEAIPQQCESQRKPRSTLPHLSNKDHGRRQILRTNGQLFEEVSKSSQSSPAPRPPHVATEENGQRQIFRTSHDQRGYAEFEIADQKRRIARMGAGQDSRGEGTTSQTVRSSHAPKPTNHRLAPTFASREQCIHHLREQSKAQQQQSEKPSCGLWVRDQAERRKLAQQNWEQQKREQQKIRPPAAKPGSLYPGPTRIIDSAPTNRYLHEDHRKEVARSELTLSIYQFKVSESKVASQETDREYKEEKERKAIEQQQQQPKATLWVPRPEATRTGPVKQLLDGVNKALEQKVDAVKAGAVKIERVENETSRAHSQQPHKCPEDRYEAGLKCGRSFWDKYDKSHPMFRPLNGIRCSSSLGPASLQPLTGSIDRPAANESTCHTETPQKDVPGDSSRTSGFHAAVEAIDRTSGSLLESPKMASDQDKVPPLEPSGVSVSPNMDTGVVGITNISLVTFKEHPTIVVPRQDAPPPPTPQAKETDMGTELQKDRGSMEDVVGKAALGGVDIHLEWQEIEYGLEDDGWSDVEQDIADGNWLGTSSLPGLECASDGVSEGAVWL